LLDNRIINRLLIEMAGVGKKRPTNVPHRELLREGREAA
jgi:hypothetical protein